jgi:uncharacterized protein DUF6111
MLRPVLTELLLFVAPFVVYAVYLWTTQSGGVLARANWPPMRVLALVGAAIVTVVVGVFMLAEQDSAPPRSTYVPAHIEDGKFVPGQTK